jgi:hypothetical protein
MIERSMIFWYQPRQTGLAGRVRRAEGEFSGTAGARAVPLDKRVKRKLRAPSRRAAAASPIIPHALRPQVIKHLGALVHPVSAT